MLLVHSAALVPPKNRGGAGICGTDPTGGLP